MMIAPPSVALAIVLIMGRLKGVSRRQSMGGRRSFSVTRADRRTRFPARPVAMAARVFAERGHTSIPTACQEPLAQGASIRELS